MKRDAGLFVAAWGTWLAIIAASAWVASKQHLPAILLTYAALGWLAIAAFVLIRGQAKGPRSLLDSSLATVAIAFGLTMALTGFIFGLWLILVGAEIALLGIVGAVRETRRNAEAGDDE